MSGNNESSTVPDYHPKGLTYDRLLYGSAAERASITEDEWARFREGLLADKGHDGLAEWRHDCSIAAQSTRDQEDSDSDDELEMRLDRELTDYALVLYRNANIDEDDPPPDDEVELEEWGFYVYRTAGYDDPDAWRRAKEMWDQVIAERFGEDVRCGRPGALPAQRKFRCRWIEGPEWEGASPEAVGQDFLKNHFNNIAEGFLWNIALCVNDASMRSLLKADAPDAPVWRFVLAVTVGCGDDHRDEEEIEAGEEQWCGYWNVLISSLPGDLYTNLWNTLTPDELGGGIGLDRIYADYLSTLPVQ